MSLFIALICFKVVLCCHDCAAATYWCLSCDVVVGSITQVTVYVCNRNIRANHFTFILRSAQTKSHVIVFSYNEN
jgi:hypothetical protein